MKVVREDKKIVVTRWMLFKAKLSAKWMLLKVFLKTFFDIREYVFVIFNYEITCQFKSPKRQEFTVVAKLSRNTPVDKIKQELFTVKPPATFDKENKPTNECSVRIIDVKIKPIDVKIV